MHQRGMAPDIHSQGTAPRLFNHPGQRLRSAVITGTTPGIPVDQQHQVIVFFTFALPKLPGPDVMQGCGMHAFTFPMLTFLVSVDSGFQGIDETFTRTLAVYVTTQQLHRLSVVQGMLKHIDFSTASPTVRLALQKGTGAGNISALNKVMKGTLVTSLALVAVTTGPDMIKMLRGRISGTQFIRNLAVASSGVAGGAVGSVAGGILFSPLGPFGALTGRVVGGVLGGMIASAVSGKIAGALVEEDRVKILAMIQEQVTWLAGSFLLTGHEIENLNENLARVIDQNALEIIFAAGIQQRAATNMLIKPLVVSIIRQRPVMEYDASHLGNMVNRLEEALPPELPA